jgi:hypothetical protein
MTKLCKDCKFFQPHKDFLIGESITPRASEYASCGKSVDAVTGEGKIPCKIHRAPHGWFSRMIHYDAILCGESGRWFQPK